MDNILKEKLKKLEECAYDIINSVEELKDTPRLSGMVSVGDIIYNKDCKDQEEYKVIYIHKKDDIYVILWDYNIVDSYTSSSLNEYFVDSRDNQI